MIRNDRDDIHLPCDCGDSVSFYLTLPPRTISQAITDISRVRDLPEWCWDLLPCRRQAAVISLAAVRAERRGRQG